MANSVIKCTSVISVVFVLCFVCQTTSLRHHIAPCEVVRPCVCEFPNGDGIDLSILSNTTLRASIAVNVTVFFQPCHKIAVANVSTCNETSLCIFNNATNQSTPLGNVEELHFNSENLVKPVELQFVHTNYTSIVDLTCPESGNETSFTGNKINNNEFHFVLKSPAACIKPLEAHHGRSLLSVLFISTLIVGVTYLVAMMIVRHSRGAVGWEIFPHSEACMRIPTLCRTGCNTLLSCCRLQPSYEQI